MLVVPHCVFVNRERFLQVCVKGVAFIFIHILLFDVVIYYALLLRLDRHKLVTCVLA